MFPFIQKELAEQATGICESPSGLGKYYDTNQDLTRDQALDLLMAGKPVEVPNAGAGSYTEFFESLGFTNVEPMDQTSSAGDWSFIMQSGGEDGDWYLGFQSNRHPLFGFAYTINDDISFPEKEEAIQYACQ